MVGYQRDCRRTKVRVFQPYRWKSYELRDHGDTERYRITDHSRSRGYDSRFNKHEVVKSVSLFNTAA
jgi:hypothetical protein